MFIYNDVSKFDSKWSDIIEFVKVVRTTKKKSKVSVDTSFYISTKQLSAEEYYDGIRGHWSIENSLHYVKDVTFEEDFSKVKVKNSVINKAIILDLVLNIFHKFNYQNMAQAVRLSTGDFELFKQFLEWNSRGMEAKPGNMLLMHAMGPNVAGVIGSAVAAGVLLSIFK